MKNFTHPSLASCRAFRLLRIEFKRSSDLPQDGLGRLAWIRCLGNRPANYKVAGAGRHGLGGRGNALLVAHAVSSRPDPRNYNHSLRSHQCPLAAIFKPVYQSKSVCRHGRVQRYDEAALRFFHPLGRKLCGPAGDSKIGIEPFRGVHIQIGMHDQIGVSSRLARREHIARETWN